MQKKQRLTSKPLSSERKVEEFECYVLKLKCLKETADRK